MSMYIDCKNTFGIYFILEKKLYELMLLGNLNPYVLNSKLSYFNTRIVSKWHFRKQSKSEKNPNIGFRLVLISKLKFSVSRQI